MRALDGELPFAPEVSLKPLLGIPRDDRNEQRAVVDLLSDAPIPGISAPQLILVEPDFDAGGLQRIGDALSSLRILGCVA